MIKKQDLQKIVNPVLCVIINKKIRLLETEPQLALIAEEKSPTRISLRGVPTINCSDIEVSMQQEKDLKKRIFEIIQIGNRTDLPSLMFDIFIVCAIFVNIFIAFFLTFEQSENYRDVLYVIEMITMVIFLVEYAFRIWTANYLYQGKTPFVAKLCFVKSFYGVVDLLTFLPYFMPFVFSGAVAFKMFRVVRIFRLFRINAQYDAFNVITDVLKDKKNQIVSSIFLVMVIMMGSSLCMYGLEHEVQPENFKNAFSGIWWSMSTLLTVGYGDIYPVTVGGKMMAIIIAFLGVGMVAIPTGIISAGFVEYYSKIKVGTYSGRDKAWLMMDVNAKNGYKGDTVKQVNDKLPEDLKVAMILRHGVTYSAKDTTILKDGDKLVLASDISNAKK